MSSRKASWEAGLGRDLYCLQMVGVELTEGGNLEILPGGSNILAGCRCKGQIQLCRDGKEGSLGQGREQQKDQKAGKYWVEQEGSSIWLVQNLDFPMGAERKMSL